MDLWMLCGQIDDWNSSEFGHNTVRVAQLPVCRCRFSGLKTNRIYK